MPHHKSAEKRVKTNERDRQRNVANRSRLRKVVTTQRALTDATEAQGGLPGAVSEIDRAVRIGLIPKSRANRNQSRAALAVRRKTDGQAGAVGKAFLQALELPAHAQRPQARGGGLDSLVQLLPGVALALLDEDRAIALRPAAHGHRDERKPASPPQHHPNQQLVN